MSGAPAAGRFDGEVELQAVAGVVGVQWAATTETVRTHVRNAMEKLGARSRAHLVAKALAEGHAFA